MSGWSCARAQSRIDRRDDLGDPERLELEQHVSECAECRGYAAWTDGTRAMLRGASPALGAHARDRVLARARLAAPAERRRGSVEARRAFTAAAAVVLAVAIAALVFVGGRPAAGGPNDVRAPAAAEAAPVAASLAITADSLTLQSGERGTAGHAIVRAVATSVVRFDASASTVWLDSGAVDVEVDPSARRPFAVACATFAAHVLGTRFVMSTEGVGVIHGAVRVVGAAGEVIVPRLGPGERWRARDRVGAHAEDPAAAAAAGAYAAESSPSAAATEPEPARPRPATIDPAERLDRARTEIAERRLGEAERAIDAALRARPSRAQRAEASTLRAEIAVLRGELQTAERIYLEVGRSYRDLPAGDLALYAAVRLHLREGARGELRALLEEYLATYPRGRFHDQARRRARELDEEEEASR